VKEELRCRNGSELR